MLAWILIFTGITIWFCIGLYIMTHDSISQKAEEQKTWKYPIDNMEYEKFLKSAVWKAIRKIAVESDYNE